VLVWEQHGRGRVGLEAYFTGPQRLPDGDTSPGYVIAGVMAQRTFGRMRVFANLENILDARQSRTSPLVMGPRETPSFPPVWGPTDGFVANAGVIMDF
jgi:iron complex outermembrane receptor protein